jgi:hypothetical protein
MAETSRPTNTCFCSPLGREDWKRSRICRPEKRQSIRASILGLARSRQMAIFAMLCTVQHLIVNQSFYRGRESSGSLNKRE